MTKLVNSVTQSLIHSEIAEITSKIEALDGIRVKLEQDLLRLQEDELELDDECKSIHGCAHALIHHGCSGRCARKTRI